MASDRRLPVVLVPGACLGGWCWRDVAGQLRAMGHEVYPVTLTGLGERVHLAGRDVDLETHITDVVNLLEYEGLDHAVLVGHSYAGIVVSGVADRCRERLDAVVYLDTSPLPGGTAIIDVQSSDQRERQLRSVNEDGEGWRWPPPDRESLTKRRLRQHGRPFRARARTPRTVCYAAALRHLHDSPEPTLDGGA